MSTAAPARPEAGEYAPYYEKYIALVPPERDITETLARQLDDVLALLRTITEEQAGSRYAADKWSIKELVGHVIDTERVFSYRALRIARGDHTPLEGFDQDDYVRAAGFDARTLDSLASEFETVRVAALSLLGSLDAEAWAQRGTANNNEVTVRAIAHIIAGHAAHHFNILRERYLK